MEWERARRTRGKKPQAAKKRRCPSDLRESFGGNPPQQEEECGPVAREHSKVEAQFGLAMLNEMLMDTNDGERGEDVHLERQEVQSQPRLAAGLRGWT